MKKSEYDKTLKSLCYPKSNAIDPAEVQALSSPVKEGIINYLVRRGYPIMKHYLVGLEDEANMQSWLEAMGYMYDYQGRDHVFLGLAEHKSQFS